MPGLLPDVDPNGLLEFSVVYTDRSLNHMSRAFQEVMCQLSATLKEVYAGDAVALVPGGGTFGMEAVARQFASDAHCLVVRNGWFSYRWSQILEMGGIARSIDVHKAQAVDNAGQPAFCPPPIEQVVCAIKKDRPKVVFLPHVETSAGMMLPDSYMSEVAEAIHSVGGILVIDCIASGAIWVDMKIIGADVIITAPQKGWSGSPCAAGVIMSQRAVLLMEASTSSSFACDLKKWRSVMQAYEAGGHAYHATLPTDSLRIFCEMMLETRKYGFAQARSSQQLLGERVREALLQHGFQSVAAEGYTAPGVVVSYTKDPGLQSGQKFAEYGVQIAAGVPLKCNEPSGFQTFRVGLFGIDKLKDVDGCFARFRDTLSKLV